MWKSTSKPAGFSLVEAIVSIIIIGIGLMAVAQFFPFSLQIIGDAQRLSTASNLALSQIEELQSLSYEEITAGTLEAKHRLADDSTSYLYHYQRETAVTYVDSDLNPSGTDIGLKKITVTVYWQALIGHTEKSISITSLASQF